MNIEEIREYCLEKPFTTEGMPFGESTLVFSVMDKMFCLVNLNDPDIKINLKATPEYCIELREKYSAIVPGYHMNKAMWNTVSVFELNNNRLLRDLINHSYEQVILKLPKYKQNLINSSS